MAQKIFILDKLFIKHSGTLDVIKTTCIQKENVDEISKNTFDMHKAEEYVLLHSSKT